MLEIVNIKSKAKFLFSKNNFLLFGDENEYLLIRFSSNLQNNFIVRWLEHLSKFYFVFVIKIVFFGVLKFDITFNQPFITAVNNTKRQIVIVNFTKLIFITEHRKVFVALILIIVQLAFSFVLLFKQTTILVINLRLFLQSKQN